MKRRRAPEPVAPPAPPQRLLDPRVEHWVSPSEARTLDQARMLALSRWTDAVHEWKTSSPGWELVLDVYWNRAYIVGNLVPEFKDIDAFEWSMTLSG